MKYYFCFILLLFLACDKNSSLSNIEYYNIPSISNIHKDIVIKGVEIDTISIDNEIESSFKGYFKVYKDTIYYSDELFNYIFRFNNEGKLIDKSLGKGLGQNEIKGFHGNLFIDNNKIYLNELTSEVSVFDAQFNKISEYEINWQINRTKEDALKNPNPRKGDTYEFDFGIPDNFRYWDEENFAIAITTSHPNFNGYYNSESYYKNSRIIALVDIGSGKVVDLIGRRSPELLNYKYLPNFDHFNYEILKNSIYVNFWCDSLIYEIDKVTRLPIDKFGFKGQNINNDYFETQDYISAKNRWSIDQKEYGYYNYLTFVKEKKLLFRGYNKGNGENVSGLQVYQDKNLIGDINVPLGLKIIGVLDNELIASNILENNLFELYKIYLNYEK